jgi:hypothetical protein
MYYEIQDRCYSKVVAVLLKARRKRRNEETGKNTAGFHDHPADAAKMYNSINL